MSRVLLINDSRFESIIMKDLLSTMGLDVKISDEYNAIKDVESFSPDYVIVNMVMKEIRGDQLIALIKLRSPHIKCLLSSSTPIVLDEFRKKRVDAVFKTPIDKASLQKIILSLGEKSSENQAKQSETSGFGSQKAIKPASIVETQPETPRASTKSEFKEVHAEKIEQKQDEIKFVEPEKPEKQPEEVKSVEALEVEKTLEKTNVSEPEKVEQKHVESPKVKLEKADEFEFCPFCGKKLMNSFAFCPYCGNKMK